MDIYEVIPTILDSLDATYCCNLSTIKNRYNTARKNKEFNLYNWINSKNYNDILYNISASIGLFPPSLDEDSEEIIYDPLDILTKRKNAHALMVTILKLTTEKYYGASDEWMNTVTDQTVITEIAIDTFLINNSPSLYDSVLYHIGEMIFDFFYCYFRWLDFHKESNFVECASEVFQTLIRKDYYKKSVITPLKKYYQKTANSQDCSGNENLSSPVQSIINTFCTMKLKKMRKTQLESNQWFYYCYSNIGDPKMFLDLSNEEIDIINHLYCIFLEPRTYRKYKKIEREMLSSYKPEPIIEVIKRMIKHNHLVFFTNKTATDFMQLLQQKKILQGEYEDIERNYLSKAYFRPFCYNELVETEFLYYGHENRENELLMLLLNLWKCQAMLLQLNKDSNIPCSKFETETDALKMINELLIFFKEAKLITDFEKLFQKKYPDYFVPERAAFLIALLLSNALVVRVRENTKVNYEELAWFQPNTLESSRIAEISKELWMCLEKQRTVSYILKFIFDRTEYGTDIYELLSTICDYSKKGVIEFKTNNRNKSDTSLNVYRWLIIAIEDFRPDYPL
ncbi:MAG: hypothetical protein SPD47_09670 [Oscillospiraceae bacterium]|nr:hypothetical protein [Oscillospiraceae bacterium]